MSTLNNATNETEDPNYTHVRVGIGIMILKVVRGKTMVLMGKRKSSHGEGQYAWPGGHFDHGETSIVGAALREIEEEVGNKFKVCRMRLLCVQNLLDYLPKHYLDIGLVAEWKSGKPAVMEPHKCEGWDWYNIDNLPSPLFCTIPRYVEAYRTGKNFFDGE